MIGYVGVQFLAIYLMLISEFILTKWHLVIFWSKILRFSAKNLIFVYLFDLILYVPSTFFQLNKDGSYVVEPVLS